MRIEVWADLVCGWAYIGKRRLERALTTWQGEPIEVVWRPFRIDPAAPATAVPLREALADPQVNAALHQSAPGIPPEENQRRLAETARRDGIGPSWRAAWRANSHDAHRLVLLAYQHGGPTLQGAVVERILRAHFVDGDDISDRAVLERVAAEAGFPAGGHLLGTNAGDTQVRELLLVGKARGITSSPTFTVGEDRLAGAQAPETIRSFLATADPGREVPKEVRRLRYAESLLDQRDPLGALTLLGPLLSEHGHDRGVRTIAARAYYASAQLRRAQQILEPMVIEYPDDSYLRLLLGRTLQRLGLADDAAPHLRLAAVMTPEYDLDD